MKNKKTIFAIVIIALIVIIAGILLLVFKSDEINPSKKLPEAKESTKKVIDGDMSNVEEKINEQHIYKNYRIKALRIASQGPFYTVVFMVDNTSEQPLEHTHLTLTFLDSNKKHLSEINVEIPELKPGETQFVSQFGVNEKAYKYAFDYKITKAKEATLPDKE